MTRITTCLEGYFKNRFNMAIDTGDFPMKAEKLVLSVFVVIKERFVPFRAAMAVIAPVPTMFVVRIVLNVTACARLVHLVLERILRMAIATFQSGMFALKWKIRITDVIKTRVVPVSRVVAALALLTAAAVVCVVGFMTSKASRRWNLE